jgi:hypothetical protein
MTSEHIARPVMSTHRDGVHRRHRVPGRQPPAHRRQVAVPRVQGRRLNKREVRGPRRYLLNVYRVLLTRARLGMVIFVPPGDRRDPTWLPESYDETFSYLRHVGVPVF